MSKRPLRKLLSLVLAIAMVLSLLPAFVALAAEDITVAVTVEKLTVNGEFIVEPMLLTMPAGSTAAQAGLAALEAHYPGHTQPYGYNGNPTQEGFYLSRVYDPTFTGGDGDDYLAEFDVGFSSGWMITVANEFIGTGAGERVLADGEVVRWQFTVEAYGADIGASFSNDYVDDAFVATANKDALIHEIAQINKDGIVPQHQTAYAAALAVLKDIPASQAEVDAALEPLTTLLGEPIVVDDPEPEPDGPTYIPMDYAPVLQKALERTLETTPNPAVGSIGGEWAVLVLARSGLITPEWAQIYLDSLDAFIGTDYSYREVIDEDAKTIIFDTAKYTENSRIIIALNALGIDARDYNGYDLVAPLSNKQVEPSVAFGSNQASRQGVNGSAYALIALDTGNYETVDDTVRGGYLTHIINVQKSGGGWGMASLVEPDLTSMVIQSLAPYYNMGEELYDELALADAPEYMDIVNAVDAAVEVLSARQNADGTYGVTSSEYIMQTILGLAMIGIDADSDPRFIKNDVSLLKAMLVFRDEATGGFKNMLSMPSPNRMSTEQAAYALIGYDRFKNDEPSLYDFSDVVPVFESEQLYTVNLIVSNAVSAKEVELVVYAENGAETITPYPVSLITHGSKITQPSTHTYELPAGTYSVRGTTPFYVEGSTAKVRVDLGGVSFDVSEDANIELNVVGFTTTSKLASADNRFLIPGTDFTATVSYADGRSLVMGDTPIRDPNNRAIGGYVVLAFKSPNFNATFTPIGAAANEFKATTFSINPVNGADQSRMDLTAKPVAPTDPALVVPTGSKVEVFKQQKNYVLETVAWSQVIDNEDGTTSYYFANHQPSSTVIYRVSAPGKTTVAGYKIPDTVVFSEKSPTDTVTTGGLVARDSGGILFNINADNHLALDVGEEFKLRSFRAPWQIINTDTGNIMIEPDYHYNILSGDDVISIEADDTITNWSYITALSAGTAVVEVTYDAIDVINGTSSTFYGAIDPQRKGVFVVTVGETGADVDITVEGKAIDSEFDTFYMLGNSATYAIDAEGATLTAWNPDVAGSAQTITDGVITLYGGNNIVKAVSANGTTYKILRAVTVTPVFTNVTNPGNEPVIGDEVRLHLEGISIPMPKMAGIYNPGFTGTLKLVMENATSPNRGVQYTFPADNYVTFTLSEKVTTIGAGNIIGTSMGDQPGSHRNITDDGKAANMTASSVAFTFGFLPEIDLTKYFDAIAPKSSFAVSLAANETTLGADETVTVDVMVSGGDFGGFDVTVEYDNTKLALVSATDLDGENGIANGNKVTFLRNGDKVLLSEAGNKIATLVFALKSDFYGDATANISLRGASVVVYAPDENVPTLPATITNDTVALTLSNTAQFDITLPAAATDITGVADGKATYGTDVTFKLAETEGYTTTVKVAVGGAAATTLTSANGTYTIAGTAVTGNIVVTATRTLSGAVELPSDDAFDGSPNGSNVIKFKPANIASGMTYLFDGNKMYWSAKYDALVYIADENLTAQQVLEKITVVAGDGNESIGYRGEIDATAGVAVNDAQIVYALYSGGYQQLANLSVKARLEADVNADGKVDMLDVRAIQAIILGIA